MKLDAVTVAALAVAGLAVYSFVRPRAAAAPLSGGDVAYANAANQRYASGAAQAMNIDYLRYWASPMSNTIYSNGSLGD